MMDWFLLWSTALIFKLPFSYGRLTSGALAGALYAVALFLPPLSILMTLVMKIIFSLIMTRLAFTWYSWRYYLKTVIGFYAVCFLVGGASLGIAYLGQDLAPLINYNGVLALANLSVSWLLGTLLILLLTSYWGVHVFRKHFLKSFYTIPVTVHFGQQIITARGLVDTGNQLRDLLTQRPVIIMEYSLLASLLPADLQQVSAGAADGDWAQMVKSLVGTAWEARVRVLPFHSLGNKKGVLLGLVPDQVCLNLEQAVACHQQVLIGVYWGSLCPDKKYQALLHPELLQMNLKEGKGVA